MLNCVVLKYIIWLGFSLRPGGFRQHLINQQIVKQFSYNYFSRCLLIFLSLLLSNFGQGRPLTDTLRPEILRAATTLGQLGGIYYGFDESSEGIAFLKFRTEARPEELVELCDNDNPVLRAYAYLALALDRNFDLFSVLINHLNDTAKISILYCDDGYDQRVGDFYYTVATGRYDDVNGLQISERERSTIDSLLIFFPGVRLEAKSNVLLKIDSITGYYARIRQIATVEKNDNAVVALAKFQRSRDIPLISYLLQSGVRATQYLGLRAVRSFPDSTFFPLIDQMHRIEIKRTGGFDY